MRIVLFLSALTGGGAQRRMLLLARGFVAAGQEVEIVTARAEPPAQRPPLPQGVGHHALACPLAGLPWLRHRRGLWVPSVWRRLAAYLRRARPDVLLSTSTPANLTALLARAVSGTDTPLVLSLNLDLEASLGRGLGGILGLPRRIARLYRGADMLVAISEGVAAGYRRLLGGGDATIVTIANPIDLAAVARGAEAVPEPAWTDAAGLPLVLACGKLKPQKDFATLIRATALLSRRRPVRLAILGEGEERQRLLDLARELGLADRLFMPGFVANPFAWMARASVFVLSSRFEGSSNVLLEALACGCPIVATDCPSGPRELLAEGRYGRLVPVGDPEALAEAIGASLDAPRDSARLRARAAEFSIERASAGYLAAIAEARRRRAAASRDGAGERVRLRSAR